MGGRRGALRPGSGWRLRALVLSWVFIAAVIAGMSLLVASIRGDNRPVALAIVVAAICFASAWGLVLVLRHRRER